MDSETQKKMKYGHGYGASEAMISGRYRYRAIECDYCRSLYRKLCNRQGKSRNPQRGTHIKVWDYVLKQCTACCGTNRVPTPMEEVIRCR